MKSYLKFLSRNKVYTSIEFIGLSVSLAFVIIIGSYVLEQFSVMHENPYWRDVYTFAMTEEGSADCLGLTYSFTEAIKAADPDVEIAGALAPMDMIMLPDEGLLQARIVTADRDFFRIFPNLEFLEGGPEVLEDRSSAIISEEFSRKSGLRVGDNYAVGETSFMVRAIMKDWKGCLFSYADVVCSIDGPLKPFSDPDDQFGSVYTFVKVRPGTDREALRGKAEQVCRSRYDFFGSSFLQGVRVYRVDELLFGDIHSDTVNRFISRSDKRTLDLLLAAVLLLLVSAIINYINLNMALSAKRAREMATRRLVGASRTSVFCRQILESTLFTAVCFAFSVLLALWWTPLMNRLLNDPDIAISIRFTPRYIALFLGLVLVVGLLSGLLPALFASRWRPIDVVRGAFRAHSKMTFSKLFIILQNALAVFLIAFAIVMEVQYAKSLHRPMHADLQDKYFLHVASYGLQSLRSSLEALPFVERTALAFGVPGTQAGGQYSLTVDGKDILYRVFRMDRDAFDMLGFEKVYDFGAQVNNTAWFGKGAFEATGFSPEFHEMTTLRERMEYCENVGGVIEDFPVSLNNMGTGEHLLVNVEDIKGNYPFTYGILLQISGDHDQAGKRIGEVYENWKKDNLVYYEISNGFLTDFYDTALRPIRNNITLMEVFMLLAVLLSLLGLGAMSTYYADWKSHDIAIRKVFGGTVNSEAYRSIRDYMVLVLLSCAIGIPLAVYVSGQYLKSFIHRLDGYWWIFILATVITMATAFISVIWQTLRAAHSAPAVQLKKE